MDRATQQGQDLPGRHGSVGQVELPSPRAAASAWAIIAGEAAAARTQM
nr:hypothetical protein [Paracoccus sp. TRP]